MPDSFHQQSFELESGTPDEIQRDESNAQAIRSIASDVKISFNTITLEQAEEESLFWLDGFYRDGSARLYSVYRRQTGATIEVERLQVPEGVVSPDFRRLQLFMKVGNSLKEDSRSITDVRSDIFFARYAQDAIVEKYQQERKGGDQRVGGFIVISSMQVMVASSARQWMVIMMIFLHDHTITVTAELYMPGGPVPTTRFTKTKMKLTQTPTIPRMKVLLNS